VQRLVKDVAKRADIVKSVTPHRLRASVATILLDAGMPLDQVQKFLRHKRRRRSLCNQQVTRVCCM
jgi:integrase/recombinase XerD